MANPQLFFVSVRATLVHPHTSSPAGPLDLLLVLAAAVFQIPGILHTNRAVAARGEHALLIGHEGTGGAVVTVVAGVLHAPGPIDLGGGGARVDGGESREHQHGESSADHSWPPTIAGGRDPGHH